MRGEWKRILLGCAGSLSPRGRGYTCVVAGRRGSTIGRGERRRRAGRKEAETGEGEREAPRPPREADPLSVRGACPRRRKVNEHNILEAVKTLVSTPADRNGARAQVKKSSMGKSEIWRWSVNMCA